ncbi:unnamed protein product, partial [Mesorhabditis belari]|uniref:Protein kinase domain-containing protein n=1 Tax=Mesorhabditis belari TaxID=2138241 RepID=A0AAF3J4Q7_9BILA
MEYCAEGSLRELITNPELNYTISTIVQWAEEIFSPIACLKSKSIAHRDIKPENIFVDSDFHLKIGDFGLVKEFGSSSSSTTNHTIVGTRRYMMPELRDGLEMSIESIFKGDVYAAGNLGKETEIEFPSTNCPNVNVEILLDTIHESVHIEMSSRIALDAQVQNWVLHGDWALKKH